MDISLSQVPGRGEVTSMLVTAGGTGGRLVIATGDNNLYTVDLETRQVDAAHRHKDHHDIKVTMAITMTAVTMTVCEQVVSTLSGHTDYIHMVAGGREGEEATLVSAGEGQGVHHFTSSNCTISPLLIAPSHHE